MKRKRNQIGALTLATVAALFFALPVAAQVTIGSEQAPQKDALLDLRENTTDSLSSKGLLLPRVALASTTATTPLGAHVKGMFVYNTATTGDVKPGIYYNDGTQWVAAAGGQSSTPATGLKLVTVTDTEHNVTDEDIILVPDNAPGDVTLNLPTDTSVPVGRTIYIINNTSLHQVNTDPAYFINTTAGVDPKSARIVMYLGNGNWQNFSGYY